MIKACETLERTLLEQSTADDEIMWALFKVGESGGSEDTIRELVNQIYRFGGKLGDHGRYVEMGTVLATEGNPRSRPSKWKLVLDYLRELGFARGMGNRSPPDGLKSRWKKLRRRKAASDR